MILKAGLAMFVKIIYTVFREIVCCLFIFTARNEVGKVMS